MKKVLFGFLMTIIVLGGLLTNQQVNAYSPDFLPGGKNYLAEENFAMQNYQYSTIDAFLVKPFTEYTLTIPGSYAGEPDAWLTLAFFANESYLDDTGCGPGTMVYYDDSVLDWYSFTFMTSAETNYLIVMFSDTTDYFTNSGFYGFQLEEGDEFTGYEPYTDGDLVDTSAPYFESFGTVISYYDSPITIAEIQSALFAYDDIDGDVTANIVLVSDNYTPNKEVLGTYEVVFEVSDFSMNVSTTTVRVEVVDVLKPLFSDIGTVIAVFPNIYGTDDIKAMLSASDNYDGDISQDIMLVSDGYTESAETVGTYQMTFSVTDSSGNIAYHIQNIQVVDSEGPVISGTTSIIIGYDSLITAEEVMANLDYTDNYDDAESLTMVLEDDFYTTYHEELGTYSMIFSVTDSSGNKTFQSVDIQVVDELGPIVYFDSSVIRTYNDTVLSLPDFLQLLVNANELDRMTEYRVTVLYDSYTRNADTPGTYHMTLKYVTESGESVDKTLEIRVVEREADYIGQIDDQISENETALSQYKEYFITGAAGLMLVVSNLVWFIVFRKK